MKYIKVFFRALIIYWLFSGVGLAHQPAGSDGQLQYNDNGTIAGAELYYSKQGQFLEILGDLRIGEQLRMDSGDFSIITHPSPHQAILSFQSGPYSFAAIFFHPNRLDLMSHSVSVSEKLGVNIQNPDATLDINGYAKLRPYSQPPVSCNKDRRGTIVMNNHYDLCVCRPTFNYPHVRQSDPRRGPDFIPTSAFRLVRDPGKTCW